MSDLMKDIAGDTIDASVKMDDVYMVVNDVSLTYRTCIQLMLDNSRLIKKVLFSDTTCNSLVFRFNTDGVELVCTECYDRKRTPSDLYEYCRDKPVPVGYTTKNKVSENNDTTVFLLSLGYIADNFVMYPSVLDLVEEKHPASVVLARSKIESLCRM